MTNSVLTQLTFPLGKFSTKVTTYSREVPLSTFTKSETPNLHNNKDHRLVQLRSLITNPDAPPALCVMPAPPPHVKPPPTPRRCRVLVEVKLAK